MRVAVIGAAGAAGQRHCRAFHEEGCDVIPVEADTVWSSSDVGVISIATPDDLHANMVCDGLMLGRHVFCEKPLAHNEFSLARIERAMNHSKGTLGCNLPLRYSPKVIEFMDGVGRFTIAQYRWGRKSKMAGWRGQIPDYSIVCGGGIHLIDLMMLRYNGKPTNIRAHRLPSIVTTCFWIGEPGLYLCSLIVDFSFEGEHVVQINSDGKQLVIDEPQDFKASIRNFLQTIQSGRQGNGREALAANRACLAIEEAAK